MERTPSETWHPGGALPEAGALYPAAGAGTAARRLSFVPATPAPSRAPLAPRATPWGVRDDGDAERARADADAARIDAHPVDVTAVDIAVPDLASYRGGLDRGRPAFVEALWMVLSALFVASFVPGSRHRRWLLALFGARIGRGVVVKPGVRVKFPWRLAVGDHSWLGEGAWIDNIVPVTIGAHACLSQGVYLCTGNHDWSRPGFDLRAAPITVADGAWIGARAVVGPGVAVGRGAIVALGAVAMRNLAEREILAAVAATAPQRRTIRPPDPGAPPTPAAARVTP